MLTMTKVVLYCCYVFVIITELYCIIFTVNVISVIMNRYLLLHLCYLYVNVTLTVGVIGLIMNRYILLCLCYLYVKCYIDCTFI